MQSIGIDTGKKIFDFGNTQFIFVMTLNLTYA